MTGFPPGAVDADSVCRCLGVSRETQERLEAYVAELIRWQRRVNLVGPRTIDDFWRRHILDSGQLALHLDPATETVADLGSGAGLPGIPLSLVSGVHVDLYESDQRKCAFLQEAIRITGADATVRAGRIERAMRAPVDLVTARALAPLARLLGYAGPFVRRVGKGPVPCLFLKGARFSEELTEAQKTWRISLERVPSLSDPHASIIRITSYERLADGLSPVGRR